MEQHQNVSYDYDAVKEMGREAFIASHPHLPNAGEWYDHEFPKKNAKANKPTTESDFPD